MGIGKPFLRWAGGKSWFVKHLDAIIGNHAFSGYHEPFLGGGAVFFALSPMPCSHLSDMNQELVNTYVQIKEHPKDVIDRLKAYENTPECYYRVRDAVPADPIQGAARFIFLNQTSYNGLYRVNQRGQYNVPFGYRTKAFLEEEKLLLASRSLQRAHLYCGDFESCVDRVQKGNLLFLDPPYTVSHNNNGFIKYNQKFFSLEDQCRLSGFIDKIKAKGAYYILTNAAHPKIREIFEKPGDRICEYGRASLIGGDKANRGQITEYIFTNIPEVQVWALGKI